MFTNFLNQMQSLDLISHSPVHVFRADPRSLQVPRTWKDAPASSVAFVTFEASAVRRILSLSDSTFWRLSTVQGKWLSVPPIQVNGVLVYIEGCVQCMERLSHRHSFVIESCCSPYDNESCIGVCKRCSLSIKIKFPLLIVWINLYAYSLRSRVSDYLMTMPCAIAN